MYDIDLPDLIHADGSHVHMTAKVSQWNDVSDWWDHISGWTKMADNGVSHMNITAI